MTAMHQIGVTCGSSWADRLTISRFVCAPMLLTAAVADAAVPFSAVAVFGVLSDIIDGLIARANATASPRGAQLDSRADLTFYSAVLFGLVLLFPAQFRAESGPLVIVLTAYAIPILIGWCKFGALTAYHTMMARIALGVVPASAVLWLSTGVTPPLYWGIALFVFSAVEEVLITLRLRPARANIPHLFRFLAEGTMTTPAGRSDFATRTNARGTPSRATLAVALTVALSMPAGAQWRVGGFAGGEHDSSWDELAGMIRQQGDGEDSK